MRWWEGWKKMSAHVNKELLMEKLKRAEITSQKWNDSIGRFIKLAFLFVVVGQKSFRFFYCVSFQSVRNNQLMWQCFSPTFYACQLVSVCIAFIICAYGKFPIFFYCPAFFYSKYVLLLAISFYRHILMMLMELFAMIERALKMHLNEPSPGRCWLQ